MNAEQDDVRSAPGAPGVVPGGGDAPAPDAPPRALAMRVGASRTPLGLVLGGAAVVLALMVGLLAFISIERSEAAMARLLAEKGSSLIMAFESILRSGMRSEAGVRLQVLLEEMAASPDIMFVAVTMPDGTIVAHSKRVRLGEILQLEGRELDEKRMRELAPDAAAQWGIMKVGGNGSSWSTGTSRRACATSPRAFPCRSFFWAWMSRPLRSPAARTATMWLCWRL